MSVEVSFNGQDYSATGVHFEYQQRVAVGALEPSRGPIEGGSFVNVTGSGFSARAALLGYTWCRFNSTSVAAAWRSSTELHCIAPRHAAGAVGVEMTQNEQQHTQDGVRFEFEVVAAYSVYPSTGPLAGGTLVELVGAGIELPDVRGLFCQFGAAEPVAATHASRELVLCVVPPSEGGAIGAVPVRVLNNDAVYGSVVAFTYRELAGVERVHPVAGMRFGGTLVTVYGTGFIGDASARCRFGGVAVAARLLTARQLECISPLPAVAGYVSVEVSFNGQDFSSCGSLFEYMVVPTIFSAEPHSGPSVGGTHVAIFGRGFSRRSSALSLLTCRFNSSVAQALFVSSLQIYCISPASSPCKVVVEVANTPSAFSKQRTVFTYAHTEIIDISPAAGPTSGGTHVTISGAGFLPAHTLGLFCVFDGASETPAHALSPRTVVCLTPWVHLPGKALISLRLDGAMIDTEWSFAFELSVPIYQLEPQNGPESGGTVVTVIGDRFSSSLPMFCRVGQSYTLARVVSRTHLACTVPPSAGSRNVTFRVTRDDLGDSPSVHVGNFEYEAEITLRSLMPDRGPSEGGTRMLVHGYGFRLRASLLMALRCRFNVTDVVAEFQSTRTVLCISPKHAPGVAVVELSTNMQQFTASGLTYTFDKATLLSVAPSHGPVLGGSFTIIKIRFTTPPLQGSSRDLLSCHFGTRTSRASFDSMGSIACISPPSHTARPGTTILSVANSHATFVSELEFVYEEEPSLGIAHPIMGPTIGGTVVAVYGTGFIQHSSIWCRFSGSWRGVNKTRDVLVIARQRSTTFIECITPSHPYGFR